jgi:hypothetical protein
VPVTVNLPLPTLARKRMRMNEQNNPGFGGFKARKKKTFKVIGISIPVKGETWKNHETYLL